MMMAEEKNGSPSALRAGQASPPPLSGTTQTPSHQDYSTMLIEDVVGIPQVRGTLPFRMELAGWGGGGQKLFGTALEVFKGAAFSDGPDPDTPSKDYLQFQPVQPPLAKYPSAPPSPLGNFDLLRSASSISFDAIFRGVEG